MKSTTTKLAATRRDVPQLLELIRVSGNSQDIARQTVDLDWLETRFEAQVSKRLSIEGLSGKDTLKDADVQAILDELADPQWSGLAISALDRLVRPGEDDFIAYSIFQKFNSARKPIYSRREGIIEPWTPEGHDRCITAAQRARAERLELRRRTMDERIVLAKQGVQCSKAAPYGFRFEKLRKREGRWIIHEEEAAVVREIFRLAAARGWTGFKIAKHLNEETAIPSPGGSVGRWYAANLRRMLRATDYVGQSHYGKGTAHETTIKIPAILATPEEIGWWDIAQVNTAKNKEALSGRPSTNLLLRSLLWCSHCGRRLTGRRFSGGRRAYVCNNRDHATHKRLCHASQIKCAKLDEAVYQATLRRLGTRATIETILRDHRDAMNASKPLGADKAARLQKLTRDKRSIAANLNDGDLFEFREENKRKLADVNAEIATIEREIAAAAKVFVMPAVETIDGFLALVERAKGWTDYQARRGFVEAAIVRVTYADGEFTVEGRIALAEDSMKSGVPNANGTAQSRSCRGSPTREGSEETRGTPRELANR